jgi:predicted acylesterase/phospholipase RssA
MASIVQGGDGPSGTRKVALILAGAAAKGPFAAGALGSLSERRDLEISTVIGASSGALNGAVYAAGLRTGYEGEAARLLHRLWRKEAQLPGILSRERRVALVREALGEFADRKEQRPVTLRVVAASLPGKLDKLGYVRAETVFDFGSDSFRDATQLDFMAEVCVASSAIPVLFPPHALRQASGEWDAASPYWDGGAVNNTPLGLALKTDTDVDHLIVITPDANQVISGPFSRLSLGRLFTLLVDERLARDLHEARSFNEELIKLSKWVDPGVLRDQLKWRKLEILEIRPERPLEGDFLKGFVFPGLRNEYLARGREAANLALGTWQRSPERVAPGT